MSRENVELAQRAFELWNRGEVSAMVDLFDPDGEIETDPRFIEGGTFRGREELRRWLEGIREGWVHGGSVITKEFLEADDRVVVAGDWSATGETSGIDARIPVTSVFTIQDGQIQRIQYFFDHDEALEAVGLRE